MLEIFHCIMRHTHWVHINEAVCTAYVHVQHVEHVEHVNEHVMFIRRYDVHVSAYIIFLF